MIGRLTTGSRGLGWLAVIGRSRVPSPPAITTAFTVRSLRVAFTLIGARVAGVHSRGPDWSQRAGRRVRLAGLGVWDQVEAAAHQYSALPQITNAQPMILAISA